MAFRVSAYQADETNVNRIWDLSAQRENHIKKLSTIYKQRQVIRVTSEKDQIRRQKQLEFYHKSKIQDFNKRNKSAQDKINYENSILRNKILDLYYNGSGNVNGKVNRKSRSVFFSNQPDKTEKTDKIEKISPFKYNQMQEMYRTNLRIGGRLNAIKSEVSAICNIQEHCKQSRKLLQMIQKKSPKKKAYLKSLTKKKLYASAILPEFEQNMITQYF